MNIETIERAVLMLAGRCDGARALDGAGFNRYDAPAGHEMARKIEAGQHPDPVYALKVVTKYRAQLERLGIELPALEAVRAERDAAHGAKAEAAPRGVEITRQDGILLIRFPYDPALVERARTLPGRRWDSTAKAWTAPVAALEQALEAFPDARLSDGLAAERETRLRAEREAEEARLRQVAVDLAAYERVRLTASLYAHQDAGARWLVERRRAIVADDMGLGKTREALAAALALGHRILVVGPAGLRVNWLREAEAAGAQIEYWSWAKVPAPPECRYTLIADEAHYAQNFKAQRTKRFLALAERAEAVFPLTGTPLKNGRPANLYPLLVAVRHEIARDRRAYEVRYCAAGPTRWSPWDATGAAHLEELHAKVADSLLRRTKDECLDLPAKTRVLRKAELAPDAQALYSRALGEMQAEYRRRLAAGEISAADALVLLTHVMHAGSLAKVDAACEIAEEVLEQGGQVVLYFRFLDSARQAAERLGAGLITGEQDADERQDAIDRFQAGALRSLVCTLGAGNVGITLTAAQTVLLVDRPWTPGDAVQAEDRLHRIGQRSAVTAIWLQANGADEALDALLGEKQERAELVLSGRRRTLDGIRSIQDLAEVVLS